MIKEIKRAKILKEQGLSNTKIGSILKEEFKATGFTSATLPKLYELYDEMEAQPVKASSSDYVCIRKDKYVKLSIKIQHKLNDMRLEFHRNKKIFMREKGKFIQAKHSYGDRKAIIEELEQKQLMLNVTSSNLNHAEDGYEYIKREWIYSKIMYFIWGNIFLLGVAIIFGKFIGKISIVY